MFCDCTPAILSLRAECRNGVTAAPGDLAAATLDLTPCEELLTVKPNLVV